MESTLLLGEVEAEGGEGEGEAGIRFPVLFSFHSRYPGVSFSSHIFHCCSG